nr:hypothetical protein [Tanacetum cinerariifolium]
MAKLILNEAQAKQYLVEPSNKSIEKYELSEELLKSYKFKEDLFASGVKHGIIQDSSEPSNENSNVANAPREPFVVNQDPGKNSSKSPPQTNHHCCYGCGDPLEGIFCRQCTCELCGNGSHYGYNCPPKVPIIPDPEPFHNQTIKELPPTVQSFDRKPDLVHNSPNVSNPPPKRILKKKTKTKPKTTKPSTEWKRSKKTKPKPKKSKYQFQKDPPEDPPEVLMADNRTMAELLQAPAEGYEDVIVIPEITANNFELKHGLINLVQNKQFFGHDKEDPHAHIRYFNKITSTMRIPNVPSLLIKLMLFPFSLEGAAQIWLEKEPPRSVLTWDDLVSKFINQFFPPSKTTNLRNEITRFQQRFDELFYEAWDHFNELLRACPHLEFSELHQLNPFYNALNVNDQDSLNSAAGGNFLDKMPHECLKIIESKSKVCQSRAKAVVAKVSTNSSTPAISSDVAELKDMVRALLLDKKNQSSAPASSLTPAPVKAVEPNCVTCSGAHSYQNCPATSGNVYRDNIQVYVSQAAAANYNQGNIGFRPQMVNQPLAYQALAYQAPIPQTQSVSKTDFESYVKANDAVLRNIQNQGQNLQIQMANLTDMLSKFVSSNTASSLGSGTLPSNIVTNLKEDLKGITTRSGVAYQGPTIPTPSKVMKQGTEPVVAPVSAPMPNLKPSIPYPSRRDNERRHDQANEQIEKF